VADSPLRNASRLDADPVSDFGGAGFDAADLAPSPVEALGFSPVHFGGGGFAGLPHEIKNIPATRLNPKRNAVRCFIKNHLSKIVMD
jgi:hypothetical protein